MGSPVGTYSALLKDVTEPIPATEANETPQVCRRSEPRFPVRLPVRIWGMDRSGRAFSQRATTLVVSVNGSRLDGVRVPLALGDVVGVQYGDHKARFRVIWVGALGQVREGQAGVWCLEGEKRLFGSQSAEVEKAALEQAASPGALPADGGSGPRGEERRQGERRQEERRVHPRHKCDGGAEVRKQGVDARVWGTLGDISLGGCYLEMMTPFPAATEVELSLRVGERSLRAGGVVRTSHAGCGMGVQFTAVNDEDRALLQKIVELAAAEPETANETPRPVPSAPASPLPADGTPSYAGRVLQGVLAFFGERDALTRREFLEILRRAKSASEPQDRSVQ